MASFDEEPAHLWVVVAFMDERPIVVNLTSFRERCDTTAVFRRGEHPWIKHDSVAFFGGMQDVDEQKVLLAIRQRQIELKTRASPLVVRRLQEGAVRSPHTPIRMRSLFKRLVDAGTAEIDRGEHPGESR